MTSKLWLSSQDDRVRPHVRLPFKHDFEFTVCNASFWEVFKFIISLGKKGSLYRVYENHWPPSHENCRCVINPVIKKVVDK